MKFRSWLGGSSSPRRRLVDSADSLISDTSVGDADVTSFSPVRTPRVSDDEVFQSFCRDSISNGSDGVVGGFKAERVIKDSTSVGLER